LIFAFSIHSEIELEPEEHALMENGSFEFQLKSGDQIDVITSTSKPTINWLDYVTTSRAKRK
jgi:GTP pyrophosphokinase